MSVTTIIGAVVLWCYQKCIYCFNTAWNLVFYVPSALQPDVLILGLKESGKSTLARQLFGVCMTPFEESDNGEINFTEARFSSDSITITECPGFRSRACTDSNAEILLMLFKYLETRRPIEPPLLLITARLNDSRFAGGFSDFTLLLKYLKLIKLPIVDDKCSNVVLVLTHADDPGIQQDVKNKISAYCSTFKTVFSVLPAYVVTRLNPNDSVVLKNENTLNKFYKRFLHAVHKKLECTQSGEVSKEVSAEVNLKHVTVNADKLYENVREILQVLNGPEQIQIEHFLDFPEEIKKPELHCFITNMPKNENGFWNLISQNDEKRKVYNVLKSTSNVLLEDGVTYLPVHACNVGQRVFSPLSPVAVITKKESVPNQQISAYGKIHLGRSVCANNLFSNNKFFTAETIKDNLALCPNNQIEVLSASTNETLFIVEVNNGLSAFVADNYICISSITVGRKELFTNYKKSL